MSGYISNFLDYTIDYLSGWKIGGKQVTESDIISVQVGDYIVTWECFKESIRDILWDTYNNDKLIISDIQIYGKGFIMFLDHDSEYNSYSWNSLDIPDSLEPDKEIRFVNIRPKVIYNRREYESNRSN
jgi:hypothetical protein